MPSNHKTPLAPVRPADAHAPAPAAPAPGTGDPLALIGEWAWERSIDDRRSGTLSHAQGVMRITEAAPGRLRWDETGTWTHHTLVVPVERTYLIERRGGCWAVLFDDGRFFHDWIVDAPLAHECVLDHYAGQIDTAANSWSTTWHVTGPHKEHRIITRYMPAGAAVAGTI